MSGLEFVFSKVTDKTKTDQSTFLKPFVDFTQKLACVNYDVAEHLF